MTDDLARRLAQLRDAYESGILDDDTYQATMAALSAEPDGTAILVGSGAVAQKDSVAAGAGGVAVGQDVEGHIIYAEQGATVVIGEAPGKNDRRGPRVGSGPLPAPRHQPQPLLAVPGHPLRRAAGPHRAGPHLRHPAGHPAASGRRWRMTGWLTRRPWRPASAAACAGHGRHGLHRDRDRQRQRGPGRALPPGRAGRPWQRQDDAAALPGLALCPRPGRGFDIWSGTSWGWTRAADCPFCCPCARSAPICRPTVLSRTAPRATSCCSTFCCVRWQMSASRLPADFFDEWLARRQGCYPAGRAGRGGRSQPAAAGLRLVEAFTRAYPDCRYVVTSRIVGYTGPARLG